MIAELIVGGAVALAVLASLVVLLDSVPRMRAALRRRRDNQGGAFGAVLDPRGRVLGVYLDPYGHPWRAARVHAGNSPWVPAGEDGWACEGFGASREEALEAAHRLRRRHLLLLGLREDDDGGGEEDGGAVAPQPWAPPAG